jgi:putative Mg2+ transporter-C (MgtC) family protein
MSQKRLSMVTFQSSDLTYLFRIFLAACCGACIGFEREKRYKTAGIRTHILVALSSCMMMIVSKYGFYDVVGTPGMSLDVSRIAAGVVTAIGFLGAGVIFVRKESITGVTTAAGLWATVGVGIAMGAGMYVLALFTTILMLLLQKLLHRPLKLFNTQLFGTIVVTLPREECNEQILEDTFTSRNVMIKNMKADRGTDGNVTLTLGVVFPSGFDKKAVLAQFLEIPFITSIEFYPSN